MRPTINLLIILAALMVGLLGGCGGLGTHADGASANRHPDGAPLDSIDQVRQKAEQGDAQAQNDLAKMYFTGRGTAKDESQGLVWRQKAADNGNPDAQGDLAEMYFTGRGVAKDERQALVWWQKAADQGNPGAQGDLGWMYANGRGVAKDYVEAYARYSMALAHGNSLPAEQQETMTQAKDDLRKMMTPEQIAAGEQRSKVLRAALAHKKKQTPVSVATPKQ